MSLEGLFTDRKVRKYIKESVMNANEEFGRKCDCCGEMHNTLSIGNYHLCEACADYLDSLTEDYDRAYESSYMDINDVIKSEFIINEAAWVKLKDPSKLIDAVNNKYGGDLNKLVDDYGITRLTKGDVKYVMGGAKEFPLETSDLKGGKSKVNRFIDDFDVEISSRAKNMLVPDTDGYSSKVLGNITPNSSATANTGAVSQPSKPSVSGATKQPTRVKGPGYSAEGDESKFLIKIAKDISIECVLDLASSSTSVNYYETKLSGTNEKPFVYTVKPGSIKDMADYIVSEIKATPCNVFTSFDDEFDSKAGYILTDYPYYSFMFDDESLDGNALTLVLALNGKPYPNTRIELGMKDIISKAALDGKLLNALNNRLAKFYPCLFDDTLNIRTSIGKTVSSLAYVDDKNIVTIHTEIGNEDFEWNVLGNDLRDKELSVNSMLHAIYDKMERIIPGWDMNSLRNKKTIKGYTDSFWLVTDPSYDVYFNFSLDELFDKHDFIFHMSVIDKTSGVEQPKEFLPITYNKAGVKLADFAKANGDMIYKKYFSKSEMVDTISASAQEKLKNRSKREVFLSYVADTFKRSLGNDKLKDLDLDIEEFDVNADHKVTNVVFRVSDPYNDVAGTSNDLKNEINLDKASWIKFVKVDDTPKSLKANGPSVIYKVTKINDFADCINLRVLESVMLEAFGLISGRKTISINEEAYWKVVDGEYTIVF